MDCARRARGWEPEGGKERTMEEKKENRFLVQFAKPVEFEHTQYTELDLSGVETLTVADAERMVYEGVEAGDLRADDPLPEGRMGFMWRAAAWATGKPIEFFKLMPLPEARKVKAAVNRVFGTKAPENGVMELEKPALYGGKTVEKLDFGGMETLPSMAEGEAENAARRAGYVTAGDGGRFLYPYVIAMAAMATGMPEEFFRALPVAEAAKLKAAVNDPRFFG